jgi:hypothetical protein
VKSRLLPVVGAAVLAVVVLAGCSSSNVGVAASVNGQRITESDVNGYVTPNAKPVSVSDQSGGSTEISPRAFVVEILVYNQLLHDLLAKTPGGAPTGGELAALKKTALGGKTARQAASGQGIKGYSDAFNREFVRRLAYASALQARSQKGADIDKLAKELDIKVSLSPRYGRWDAKALTIDTRPEAAVPSFVTLQPTPAGAPNP